MPSPMTLIVLIVIVNVLIFGAIILGRAGLMGRGWQRRECPHCSASNRAEANYCANCGAPL